MNIEDKRMVDIQKIDVFLQIWIIFTRIFDANACLPVTRGDSYIVNALIVVQDQTLVLQCAKLCMQYRMCLSFSLSLHSLQCRLNAVTKERYPEFMMPLIGRNFVYLEKTDFQKNFPEYILPPSCGINTKYIKNLNRCIPPGPLVNAALGKKTASSSAMTARGITFVSEFAVDGNWGSNAYNDGCAHTGYEKNPWWTVDLQYPYIVYSITIQNRADDNVGNRLHDIKIFVGPNASSLQLCGTFDGPGYDGQRVEVTCKAPIVGSFVEILLNDTEYLMLCEVCVHADQLL